MNGCSLVTVKNNRRSLVAWAVIFHTSLLFTAYRICKGDNIYNQTDDLTNV